MSQGHSGFTAKPNPRHRAMAIQTCCQRPQGWHTLGLTAYSLNAEQTLADQKVQTKSQPYRSFWAGEIATVTKLR